MSTFADHVGDVYIVGAIIDGNTVITIEDVIVVESEVLSFPGTILAKVRL